MMVATMVQIAPLCRRGKDCQVGSLHVHIKIEIYETNYCLFLLVILIH